jgi:DNA mismatch repair protein MutS
MTSAGSRLLKKWIEQPLLNLTDIEGRHLAVLELKTSYVARSTLRDKLKSVYDIERLISRIVMGNCNCRDFLSLKSSLAVLPDIKSLIAGMASPLIADINSRIDILDDICGLISESISDDAPITVKEGNMIKQGYDREVDQLRSVSRDGKSWIAALEAKEKELSGVKNLKIGYNRVFGYYIEITKSFLHLAPDRYIRKQTLANCERYITEELKKLEDDILGAEDKLLSLEHKLFMEIRDKTATEVARIKSTAGALSELDALQSFAAVAEQENYTMPRMNRDGVIKIADGRHPVVEKFLGGGNFVPNDTDIDLNDNRTSIITGPNMAGKSTYMRQVALIVLLAQAGSFVPAREADIGICDRIFTRVGASDDLASGQSTFMIEMSEVANIIKNATRESLIVLDEIGRGTSTFDGLSIAWAVIEFITDSERIGARTLFSTHYHELTELEGKIPGIKNYCVMAEEKGDDVIFLHKIKRGGADGSYGIHVARLAGVPESVGERAKELLKELEDADISKRAQRSRKSVKPVDGQIDFFSVTDTPRQDKAALEMLRNVDITRLTPIESMNFLYELKQKLKLG